MKRNLVVFAVSLLLIVVAFLVFPRKTSDPAAVVVPVPIEIKPTDHITDPVPSLTPAPTPVVAPTPPVVKSVPQEGDQPLPITGIPGEAWKIAEVEIDGDDAGSICFTVPARTVISFDQERIILESWGTGPDEEMTDDFGNKAISRVTQLGIKSGVNHHSKSRSMYVEYAGEKMEVAGADFKARKITIPSNGLEFRCGSGWSNLKLSAYSIRLGLGIPQEILALKDDPYRYALAFFAWWVDGRLP